MSMVTFGRRGSTPAGARVTGTTVVQDPTPSALPAPTRPDADTLGARLPLVTAGLIGLLSAVFTAEIKLGFGAGTTIDHDTLVAFGGTSWAAVIGQGEVWRLPLAPLLHGSQSHLLGNLFSLLSIGVLLEPLVGHAWFAAIFTLGALGASATSLIWNPPALIAVGASGGIMALVAAAFTMSWHHRAADDAAKILRRSLFFGVPALLPIVLHLPQKGVVLVDHGAHLGGAVVGAVLGLLLQAVWPDDHRRPLGAPWARMIAVCGLLAACLSAAVVATHHARDAAIADDHRAQRQALLARIIPDGMISPNLRDAVEQAEALLRRYPQDPRSHILQAYAWLQARDLADAEREARTAATLIDQDALHLFDEMKPSVLMSLALIDLQLGRRGEARETARLPCQSGDKRLKEALDKVDLCR